MKNYKMIVLDIDDTLVNSKRELTEKTKDALIKAQENGVKVTLCSGRPTLGMKKLANQLQLDKFGGYIISFNGANVTDAKDDSLMYENCLSVEQIHKLYDLSVENGVGIHTYSSTHIIAEKLYKYTQRECEITEIPFKQVENFKETINNPVVKAIMADEPELLSEIEQKVLKHTKGMYDTFSKPYFFEFMNEGVDKGLSMKFLCEKIGIPLEKVIAFGDSHNDLPMLKYAGKSIAMGNAVDEAKEIADFVTKSNDEEGISYALDLFL